MITLTYMKRRSFLTVWLNPLLLVFLLGPGKAWSQPICGSVATQTLEWSDMASLPQTLAWAGAGVINNLLYLVGGMVPTTPNLPTNSLYSYNPTSNSWSTLPSLPVSLLGISATGDIGGLLYAAGGFDSSLSSDNLYSYNPGTSTWSTLAPLPTAVHNAASAAFSNIFYLAGGFDGGTYTTLQAYTPATNSWATLASMPSGTTDAGAVALNGLLYVAGGMNTLSNETNMLQVYNPATNTWATLAPMPVSLEGLSALTLGGILYVIGGYDGTSEVNSVEAYDPSSNTWTTLGNPLPQAVVGLSGGAINNVIYEAGGVAPTSFVALNQAATFNCNSTPTWTSTVTPTSSPSPSWTPSATASQTPTVSITSTGTATLTPLFTQTPTQSPTPTSTLLPTFLYIPQNVFSPSQGNLILTLTCPFTNSHVNLRVYNTAGELVKTLADETFTLPTQVAVTWNGTNQAGNPCASGVYLFYLSESQEKKTAKIILIR